MMHVLCSGRLTFGCQVDGASKGEGDLPPCKILKTSFRFKKVYNFFTFGLFKNFEKYFYFLSSVFLLAVI